MDDRDQSRLARELDQHRAILSALVAKAGITPEDLLPYMNSRHPSPAGEIGDKSRLEDAQDAFNLVKL